MKQLALMLAISAVAHARQTDLQGKPYYLHCLAVRDRLHPDATEFTQCVALGHDLIEDTPITADTLRQMGVHELIIGGIVAMSKTPGQEYQDYLKQVLTNPYAILVKMADLRHNSDFTRLRGIKEKDLKRLAKYAVAYDTLQAHASAAEIDIITTEARERSKDTKQIDIQFPALTVKP